VELAQQVEITAAQEIKLLVDFQQAAVAVVLALWVQQQDSKQELAAQVVMVHHLHIQDHL
jgi:hypothetical protein